MGVIIKKICVFDFLLYNFAKINVMKISTDPYGNLVLKEVFNPSLLESPSGEICFVSMRDGGFEIEYAGRLVRCVGGNVEITEIPKKKDLFF